MAIFSLWYYSSSPIKQPPRGKQNSFLGEMNIAVEKLSSEL